MVDHISTNQPRKLEVLWHYHPDCSTVIQNNIEVVSNDEDKGNLRIVPIGMIPWEVNIIKGKTEPYIQGWYSETYGKKNLIQLLFILLKLKIILLLPGCY